MNYNNYIFVVFVFMGFLQNVNSSQLMNNVIYNRRIITNFNNKNPFARKYYQEYLQKKKNNTNFNNQPFSEIHIKNSINNMQNFNTRRYPLSRPYYIEQLKRLNSKNVTIQNQSILGDNFNVTTNDHGEIVPVKEDSQPILIIRRNNRNNNFFKSLGIQLENDDETSQPNGMDFNANNNNNNNDDDDDKNSWSTKETKSKNFEVIYKYDISFKDVGGYENVKQELEQCVDILKNYKKYAQYNIRIPKGLILEGPPGTGKTLLAKALAGQAKCNFISVSGSDFQEKYVGVGPTRIKELFSLAKKNVPCIIFIDEVDAVGKKRSSDGESSSSERDNTLNALLVELDGFKNNTGVFLVAATNRIDLLDNALTRPGRIDKKIYIGLPDSVTREAIINIHIKGKPYNNKTIILNDLVEITEGLSGAQIENLLNEAMLNALRNNNTQFCYQDFDFVMNKMMAGWQPNDHDFTTDIIDHIAIHEMGHAVVGLLSKHHSKVTKVVINLSSPKSPGYTVFEGSTSSIYTREALFEHLMILLAGRIAEEVFYDVSVTTGAINDFEEALKLAEKMVIYYGMGNNIIYPHFSEKYKELIDNEVVNLINQAYKCAEVIIISAKDFINETSTLLKNDKMIKVNTLTDLLQTKYQYLEHLKIDFE
jgi:cell division protease FtsH